MTDGQVLEEVREWPERHQQYFVEELRAIWTTSEMEWMRAGRMFPCQCLVYRDGDYAAAAARVKERLLVLG